MVFIDKGSEPRCLTEHRLKGYASYDNLSKEARSEIYNSLLTEQGYICTYCMQRITNETMHIEHYIPQSVEKSVDLDYKNMLGVCSGNKEGSRKQQTCDKHRENISLVVNPLDKKTIGKIGYSYDGIIYSNDSEIEKDLDKTLNLNEVLLKANRKAAIDELINRFKKDKSDGSWKSIAQRYRDKLHNDSVKRPYYGILLWYLDKKIR